MRDAKMAQGYFVPLDGSKLAEAVLPAATAFAFRFQAPLTLFHALERNAPSQVHGERHLTDPAEAESYLRETCARIRDAGVSCDFAVQPALQDDVAQAIAEGARQHSAGTTVLCTHGSGGLKAALFGSIAQRVLRRQDRQMLLIPPKARPSSSLFQVRHVLTALDAQENHRSGIPVAASLGRAFSATVHLFLAVPTLGTVEGEQALSAQLMPSAARAVLELSSGEAEAFLHRIGSELRQSGLQVEEEIARGAAARELVDRAKRLDDSLIVLSTHGRMGLDALFAGSVTPRVTGRTTRPLLLVPAE